MHALVLPMPTRRMPTLYLGHGAPPLMDDPLWPRQLERWARDLPRPTAILIVSAHWEEAPLTIGATRTVPLVHDFYGFPRRYYEVTYPAPGAPDLAGQVRRLVADLTPTADDPERGLDHGAYVPLLAMYPATDIPVLQISMPSEDPRVLLEVGRRLAPLRDQGVLIIGSGFLTHSFEAIRLSMLTGREGPPSWIGEFDNWAAEALAAADVDGLLDYRRRAPAVALAHPTVDHFIPLFVALGASLDDGAASTTRIDGYWKANSKRSLEFSRAS
jgi:4,5-DOPA dioxygenase extradiol